MTRPFRREMCLSVDLYSLNKFFIDIYLTTDLLKSLFYLLLYIIMKFIVGNNCSFVGHGNSRLYNVKN